jgi:hypothetical protein
MTRVKPILEGYNKEKSNCTVVALSAVTQLPYNQCKDIAATAGRKEGKGFRSADLIEFYNTNIDKRFEEVYLEKRLNVKTFCKEYPKGRYYVRKRGHAFSVINGVVYDMTTGPTPRSFVQTAWKFE